MDDLKTLDSVSGKPPAKRVADVKSLNGIVAAYVLADEQSALARIDEQKMLDGAPPFEEVYLRDSGQEGRCNLNFGDGKARVKSEQAGYYDLTDSVPQLARILTPFGDPQDRSRLGHVMSEEFHRMMKDWKAFDPSFQLLIQKTTSHGLGFLYFQDDLDWRWSVAGLDDFKVPRQVNVIEDELDGAVVFRDVTVGKLYRWMEEASDTDTRWNKEEVRKAIIFAHDPTLRYGIGEWEKWQQMAKNNDMFASATAKTTVSLAHVWIKEFSGKVSQYLTLRNASNLDYLFKCEDRFDCIDQCFTYFPYEVGSNGTLHSVRGLAHEIYPMVQVLNNLRGQTVDNAKLSGSLLLQPKTATDAEDMAILFYAGAAYIPPGVEVQNGNLNNPSQGILPIIQDMQLTLRRNSGDINTRSNDATQREKTKFEVQGEMTKESVLPTANLNLFYQPWGRHLSEVWRRVRRKGVKKTDPGGQMILDFFKRCADRDCSAEAIYAADQIMPMRAIGYGSPTNRLLAYDEFLQYYGSLDPVGQNNLLRDRFAQKVGYQQVDDYVPRLEMGGRAPVDQEIAELQNMAMGAGKQVSVRPNDNHIIHLQTHLPDLQQDCDALEGGQGNPQTLGGAQIKIQHSAGHMNLLKPDKLNGEVVAELKRVFNNTAERVKAATDHADRLLQKQQEEQQAALAEAQQTSPKSVEMMKDAETRRQIQVDDHQLKARLREAESTQKMALKDAEAAHRLQDDISRLPFRNGQPVESQPTPPTPPPLPALPAPAAPAIVPPQ